MIEVERVEKAIRKTDTFLHKVFSEREINKCEATANKYQCYAARFAAKEAFMKALGSGWAEGIKWSEIEIVNNEKGKPLLNLSGEAKRITDDLGIKNMDVSLTHLAEFAMAAVILIASKPQDNIQFKEDNNHRKPI